MTRFFTATAIATLMSTSAMALTEREEIAIKRYAPDANLSVYSDQTIDSVMNILSSGDKRSDKIAQVRGLLMMDDAETLASVTEGQEAQLERYVDEARIATMTRAEKRIALTYISSGESAGETQAKIDALLLEDGAEYAGNDATSGEAVLINRYAPERAAGILRKNL